MDARQLMVCASALFADGYTHEAIATTLNVSPAEAAELTAAGANEQAAGTLGLMKNTMDADGKRVVREDKPSGQSPKAKPLNLGVPDRGWERGQVR